MSQGIQFIRSLNKLYHLRLFLNQSPMLPLDNKPNHTYTLLRHSELYQRLEERISSLLMQVQLLEHKIGTAHLLSAHELVDGMRREWREFGLELIEHQISIEEEMELKGIIHSYEERVAELIFGLTVKEEDLIYEEFEGRKMKEYLPHRQNLNLLSMQWDVEDQISKCASQVKKLTQEIKMVEQSLQQRWQVQICSGKGIDNEVQAVRRYSGAAQDKKLVQTVKLICYERQKQIKLKKEIASLINSINQSLKVHQVIHNKYISLALSSDPSSTLKEQQPTKHSVETVCSSEDWEMEQSR